MIIDNRKITVKSELKAWIEKSDEVFVCSPFITSTDLLFDFLDRDVRFTLICRLSSPATPELFGQINSFSNKTNFIYLFDDSTLHSKIFYFKSKGKGLCAIVGSSNFTDSGIYSNKECNVLLKNDLEVFDDYFNFLIKESYCKLDNKAIENYKTFYKPVERIERYRNAKVSTTLSDDYTNILRKFNTVKGLLQNENNTELPFTYVFDSFCHFFKVGIQKNFEIHPLEKFSKRQLKKYFKLFIDEYFSQDVIDNRMERYSKTKLVYSNFDSLSEDEIKSFFLGIHSISSGPGLGVRRKNINDIDYHKLVNLLDFLINNDLYMPQKYAIALTDQKNNGQKIDYLGVSAIGEIPGWLMPDEYPILNGKLRYILDFFKI
jgi:HKD family nuclease